jgi:chromosome segregation ATPase
MDQKNQDFLDSRLGSILTGVTINLVAGAVVLLLAKVCLPENVTSWRAWLSLLISVLAVGTVVWLGVNQWMELKAVKASQRAPDELAEDLRASAAETRKFRDQLEAQIEGLGQRIDEVAGEVAELGKAREADVATVRRQLTDKIEGLSKRVDEASAGMTSSLNALEEAKMHEAAGARKQMLDQVAAVNKRIDELKGGAAGPNPAVEALKQGLARLTQDLAELRGTVESLRAAQAAHEPRIIPPEGTEKA